jgi:hypothetical protein
MLAFIALFCGQILSIKRFKYVLLSSRLQHEIADRVTTPLRGDTC